MLFCIISSSAQVKLELTPHGFAPVEIKSPNKPVSELIELSKAWANSFNKDGYDISHVTENSVTIQARNEDAYHSYNLGVKYDCDIMYSLSVIFGSDQKYKVSIAVKEIYADNALLKTTTPDFFTSDGKLRDDFKDAKPSLENTVNGIVNSYIKFMAQ